MSPPKVWLIHSNSIGPTSFDTARARIHSKADGLLGLYDSQAFGLFRVPLLYNLENRIERA